MIDHLRNDCQIRDKIFPRINGLRSGKDSQLIGQFGVGFYSAFIVADKVTVRTRAAGDSAENGVFWESAGEGDYTVADITKADRGTEITLHLREGEDDFLNDWRVRSIISKYSDHIALPVEIEKREEVDGETVISREKSTRPRRCGPVISRKSKTTDITNSINTLPDYSDPLTQTTTAWKANRSTPACCTSRRRRRGICGTAIHKPEAVRAARLHHG